MVKRYFIGVILLLSICSTATYAQSSFNAGSLDGVNQIEYYPNPAVDFLSVSIKNSDLNNVQLELFSILGNKLNVSAEAMGNDRYRFDVHDLDAGYYLLVVRDPVSRFRETYKFLKK
ncbi:MAG: T9SS type A sorting domain-containing protein [Bacteroidota bacterium]